MPTLPVVPYPVNTPREMEEGDYWFDVFEEGEGFDTRFDQDQSLLDALLAKGIGSARSPVGFEWMSFCMVGAVHAVIRGSLIGAPQIGPNPNEDLFPVLWNLLYGKPKELDPTFSAALLRLFLPRYVACSPDSYYISYLYNRWALDRPLEGLWLGYLDPLVLKNGQEVFATLPPAIQDSILKVAEHMPAMIEIASKKLIERGHW